MSFRLVNVAKLILLTLTAGAILAFALTLVVIEFKTPTAAQVLKEALGSDRVLLAADGRELQTIRTDFNKRRLGWRPLSSFPESLVKAVVASEDHRFYSHWGLDPIGLSRAFAANLKARWSGRRALQGGSTLSMQLSDLIRDDVLNHDHSIRKGSWLHKFAQAAGALALESKWSKTEILEAYLNLIHLKGEYQGIPATSWAYLKKDPLALSVDESSVLTAMIPSPNQSATVLARRACGLKKKVFGGTCDAINGATKSFFIGAPSMPESVNLAPHLARRIFSEHSESALLTSTIDARLQSDVDSILEKNIARLKDANVRDTAAIVIENRTGRVLAYVGAVSTSESPYVDGVTSYRQAGSSLKPFLYGRAFDQKTLTPASILLDEPTAISWGADVYRPTNYDKHFYGPVSAREALSSSLNVPAVKVVTIIGLSQAYNVLTSLHFTHLREPDFYGASLALGAVEVRLDELANAYRTYANGGHWSPLRFTQADSSSAREQIYSPEASFVIGSILSDANSRAIGFGWESPLETPFWTAVKTGTSKDYRDNWCVGYSEKYTVAVWSGNFNSEAMRNVSGVTGVGPSWYQIMLRLHERERSMAPMMPLGVVMKDVRHNWESQPRHEYFIRGTEPSASLIETSVDKRVQFVFPAENSVLVRDPHQDQDRVALFVRFSGLLDPQSHLSLDGKDLGEAVSPFKLTSFSPGPHVLAISGAKTIAASVHFTVKGALN